MKTQWSVIKTPTLPRKLSSKAKNNPGVSLYKQIHKEIELDDSVFTSDERDISDDVFSRYGGLDRIRDSWKNSNPWGS